MERVSQRRARRGEARRWIDENIRHAKPDECLIFPFSFKGKGYPQISLNGRSASGHRYALEQAKGLPPSPDMAASHLCGVGMCVNPHHLMWETPSENEKRKLHHGTLRVGERNPQAKLTEESVRTIRRRYAAEGISVKRLGDEVGVSHTTVWRIVTRETWSHVEP